MGCVECSNPCDVHEFVPAAMEKKLDFELPLSGTVKKTSRVLFVCSGDRGDKWSKKVGKNVELNSPKLDQVCSVWLKALKQSGSPAIAYISSDEALDVHTQQEDEFDVLVFPERVRFANVNLERFQQLLSNDISNVPNAVPETYEFHIFVCTHAKRDKRCGVLGTMVLHALQDEVEKKELTKSISIQEMSHVGGHKFAGNVLIYPFGHLYGRVRLCHVSLLIQKHCIEKEIIREIYRGCQLSAAGEEQGGEEKN
jgi:(2Fe-2S) ferredoxin